MLKTRIGSFAALGVAAALVLGGAAVVLEGAAPATGAPGGPTVTVDQAATQADPTTTSPVEFSVVFSEAVSGFTAADVDVSASTAGGSLTVVATQGVDAAHFTVDVSGMTSAGDVVVAIPAAAAESVANPALTSLASTSTDDSVTYTAADGSAPLAIQVPADVTVGNDPGSAGAHVTFAAPTSTGGVAPVTIQCDATSGDFFPLGSTVVMCTATDSSVDGLSNVSAQAASASGSFTVTVLETTPTTPGGAVPGGSGSSPAGTVIPGSTSALAFTGSSSSPILWIALGALVVGLVLLFGGRRWFRGSSGGS